MGYRNVAIAPGIWIIVADDDEWYPVAEFPGVDLAEPEAETPHVPDAPSTLH